MMSKEKESHQQVVLAMENRNLEERLHMEPERPLPNAGYDPTVDLQSFLSRPVVINETSWSVGNTINFAINPWEQFLENPVISSKLQNFSRLRGKLVLEIVINAMPFHYGALLASYRPLNNISSGITTATAGGDQLVYAAVQSPRIADWVYPQSEKGVKLEVPFLSPTDWINLRWEDFPAQMGVLNYNAPHPLASATIDGTGPNISIRTFAYMKDVQLAGPSSQLILQSDEYEADDAKGPISVPATAVANVAEAMSSAPIIGPYARATEMIARGVGAIAKQLGYSQPPVISNIQPFRPHPYSNMATVGVSTASEKLTLDPKNEITIDPCTVGLPAKDEMHFDSFMRRPSFLANAPWSTSDGANTTLMTVVVAPTLCRFQNAPNPDVAVTSFMGHVSHCFSLWRGSIRYRLRAIASKFHRGRLRIVWDPAGLPSTSNDAVTEQYSLMWDVSKDQEIEFEIPYLAVQPWLLTDTPFEPQWSEGGGAFNPGSTLSNGAFRVSVMNELTSPAVSDEIQIYMDVCAGKDFELASPKDPPRSVNFGTAGVPTVQTEEREDEQMAPDNTLKVKNVAPGLLEQPCAAPYTVGEVVTSLRTLLKRSILSDTIAFNETAGGAFRASIQTRRGPSPYENSRAIGAGFKYSNGHSYIRWLGKMFVGYRGGIRYDAVITSEAPVQAASISRSEVSLAQQPEVLTTINLDPSTAIAIGGEPSTGPGVAVTHGRTQMGLTATCPMYNMFKFYSNRDQYYETGLDDGTGINDGSKSDSIVTTIDSYSESTGNEVYLKRYFCAEDDFSFVCALSPPVYYATVIS